MRSCELLKDKFDQAKRDVRKWEVDLLKEGQRQILWLGQIFFSYLFLTQWRFAVCKTLGLMCLKE